MSDLLEEAKELANDDFRLVNLYAKSVVRELIAEIEKLEAENAELKEKLNVRNI